MTRYVLVSDIHANYPALKAVVDAEGRNANYLVLGDLLGLNGYPKETVELIQSLNAPTISGNHDVALTQHNEGHVNDTDLSEYELSHTVDALSDAQLSWVSSLPSFKVIEDGPNKICLTHAKPWVSEASGYEVGNAGISKGNVPHFASKVADEYDFVFHGHTHVQYNLDCVRFGHNVHFVSPGSLGYDGTYAIVDTDTGDVELKSVQIDEEKIKEHIKTLLPDSAPPVSRWY